MSLSALTRHNTPLILIVDDDQLMRLMMRHMLEREGYQIHEVTDGSEAVAAFERLLPDMVLMDAVMPEMDGFKACQQIKALSHGNEIPILMITGLDDDDSVKQAFAMGAHDYVTKPIHWAVLCQRTRRMLEASRAERHVRHLAYYDILTGLPNRVLLADRLGQALAKAQREPHTLAVLFVDLDRFKQVNDTFGHDAGDKLLKEVAKRLTQRVRENDTVARLGGDEFIVLLDGIQSAEDAALVARKLLEGLKAPFDIGDLEIAITASIGIAVHPYDGNDIGRLVKHADTAMYRAKEYGLNRYEFYQAKMTTQALRHLELENRLRRALEQDNLEVHYQPQVELATGQVIGVEALARWRCTEGLIPPAEFITLAENTGLIASLGERILRLACAQQHAWCQAGLPWPRVAVNVSRRQIHQPGFLTVVTRVLEDTGLEASYLVLEFTENTLMEDPEAIAPILKALKALGIGLAIDNFGTGYSSLSYLKRFPIDILKIDHSFIRHLPGDPDAAAIVSAIIALGRNLRLQVIAEGIETLAQATFLRAHSCHGVQGPLYGKPFPAEELSLSNSDLAERITAAVQQKIHCWP